MIELKGRTVRHTGALYTLQERIGQGGFASVYKAQQSLTTERPIAVKALTRQPVDQFRKLFAHETKIHEDLQHEHIIPLLGTGILNIPLPQGASESIPYMLLQYADIGSTEDIRRTTLPVYFQVIIEAAKAIQYIHNKDIIHRDVKTANILLGFRPDGSPGFTTYLNDFTIALLPSDPIDSIGTPEFASPEQMLGHAVKASDQYGLGVTAYYLFGGELPFVDEGTDQIRAHREIIPRPLTDTLRRRNKRVTEPEAAIESVIARTLEKDPQRRYESVAAFADDFRIKFMQGVELQSKNIHRSIPSVHVEINGKHGLPTHEMVRLFIQEGNYDRALDITEHILRLKPTDRQSLFDRGVIYEKKQDYQLAIRAFNKAIELVSAQQIIGQALIGVENLTQLHKFDQDEKLITQIIGKL